MSTDFYISITEIGAYFFVLYLFIYSFNLRKLCLPGTWMGFSGAMLSKNEIAVFRDLAVLGKEQIKKLSTFG